MFHIPTVGPCISTCWIILWVEHIFSSTNKVMRESQQLWSVKVWHLNCLLHWVVKEATLTHSWSIQQPPTPNHEPHCSLRSLPLFFHHLYPFLPSLFLTSHLRCPVASLNEGLELPPRPHAAHTWLFFDPTSTDTLPVWLCQISRSFSCDSLSLSVCQYLCVLLHLFALLKAKPAWERRNQGIREEENQPIVKGWHDGHYRCMMANYNLFFTICVGAVDRISKCKRSAASLMTVYSECFSLSQKLPPHKAKSVNLAQQLSAQGSWPLDAINEFCCHWRAASVTV